MIYLRSDSWKKLCVGLLTFRKKWKWCLYTIEDNRIRVLAYFVNEKAAKDFKELVGERKYD